MKYVAEYMPNIVEIQDQGNRTGGRGIYNTNTQLVIQEPSIQKPSTKIKYKQDNPIRGLIVYFILSCFVLIAIFSFELSKQILYI